MFKIFLLSPNKSSLTLPEFIRSTSFVLNCFFLLYFSAEIYFMPAAYIQNFLLNRDSRTS
jgi:hypothetical protein